MRRGSTPTHRFAVPIDLTGATVYITYQQNGKTALEKTGSDLIVTEQYIDVPLTQDDTLAFPRTR
ncbi:MAG: hypothetical protein Q4B09_04990 [Lachnospiraceae bacterium]|nr:hypothetical protein [Lachnospiraceae bacterium]